MVKIYGYSDDLVEIEGSKYYEDEIGCYNKQVRISFEDGTIILVGYPSHKGAIWWIFIERMGDAHYILESCTNEDADIYSDVFMIDSEIVSHQVV